MTLVYAALGFAGALAGAVGAEIFLAYRAKPRLPLPFYNKIYPYVMFRPAENYTYETQETYEMSHHRSRVFSYSNEDGFRLPSPGYKLPKEKPPGQLRIAFLGGSLVQVASTFDVTPPGALKAVLLRSYPGRDIEVINAGIQSSVSRQSLVQLVATVVDYHPDIVILYDGGNDIGLPFTYESRPNFPYNFQTMEDAWDQYRQDKRDPLWRIALQRSYLFRAVRARLDPSSRKLVPTSDDPYAGTNAVPASRMISDPNFAREHIAAYLSNWRKVVELSRAYGYRPVCILTPAPGMDAAYGVSRMMEAFHLDRATALEWVQAFTLLYAEARRQMETLRADYPAALFLDMSELLRPPEKYFYDLAHVYDESNAVVAQEIYKRLRPAIEECLRAGSGKPR
jgi:lysophospholipase L1-like esterase